jgi:hypothetical protein
MTNNPLLSDKVSSYIVGVPSTNLTITSGEPSEYIERDGTGSGKPVHRFFCGTCGSPLWEEAESSPGTKWVKPALFDSTDAGIEKEIFWKRAMCEYSLMAMRHDV